MHASIRSDAGEISGTILTRDISERLAADAERELLQREHRARVAADAASRMKDEFLTTLSHELRTPATSILGWARVLRSGRMGSADSEHALDALERGAKAQAGLIEDLLDVSRIVSGTMRLSFQAVRVPNLLAAAVAVLRRSADAKGVSLFVDGAEAVPPVQADPARLQQVFWNLLSNAIKFTIAAALCMRESASRSRSDRRGRDTGRDRSCGTAVHLRQVPSGDGSREKPWRSRTRSVDCAISSRPTAAGAPSPRAGQGAHFSVRLPILRNR
jgi:signal transduction histidine kinase